MGRERERGVVVGRYRVEVMREDRKGRGEKVKKGDGGAGERGWTGRERSG